jgi:hypothetical protein
MIDNVSMISLMPPMSLDAAQYIARTIPHTTSHTTPHTTSHLTGRAATLIKPQRQALRSARCPSGLVGHRLEAKAS